MITWRHWETEVTFQSRFDIKIITNTAIERDHLCHSATNHDNVKEEPPG